jgi:hypothetical protein
MVITCGTKQKKEKEWCRVKKRERKKKKEQERKEGGEGRE